MRSNLYNLITILSIYGHGETRVNFMISDKVHTIYKPWDVIHISWPCSMPVKQHIASIKWSVKIAWKKGLQECTHMLIRICLKKAMAKTPFLCSWRLSDFEMWRGFHRFSISPQAHQFCSTHPVTSANAVKCLLNSRHGGCCFNHNNANLRFQSDTFLAKLMTLC